MAKGIRVPLLTLPLLVALISGVFAEDNALLERGEYLVEGIMACGNCHTPKNSNGAPISELKFAGGFNHEVPAFKAYASNITTDEETGIGSWTDEQIIVALREGRRPDGKLIGPPMPTRFYSGISDNDAKAIVAYLRTIKPVNNVVPESKYNFPPPKAWGPPVKTVPDVARDDELAYGRYLTHTLGICTECHTPMERGRLDFSRTNAGGRLFKDLYGLGQVAVSRNITPHPEQGIGSWTDAEVKRAVTEGVSPGGRKHMAAMGYSYYANITEPDLEAIVTYLRSVPPSPPINQKGK